MFKIFNPDTLTNLMDQTKAANDAVGELIKNNDAMLQSVPKWKYVTPKNTPSTPLLNTDQWELTKTLQDINDTLTGFANGVKVVFDYITHPVLLFKAFAGASYWICLVVGLTGILLYILYDYKKGGKIAAGSVGTYVVVQAINCLL